MFLKKIKNNNRGADIAILGTNYLLVLVVICCVILDLTIIEYGKITMVTILKQCEMYSLAKHYDNEEMWATQDFQLSQSVMNDVRHTFTTQFNNAIGGGNSYMQNVSIANNSSNTSGSGISITGNKDAQALIISVPKVYFTPKKILVKHSPNFVPFVSLGARQTGSGSEQYIGRMNGIHTVSRNGSDIIVTGASCKIAFIGQ